jgi:uncharacterized protein with GYD domain
VPTFILLIQYTEEGIETIKDGPSRLDLAKQAWRDEGGELKAFYLTMGQHDAVAVVESPDAETAARLALAGCARGTIRTETMRAFTEDEYRGMVAALP